MPWLEAVAAALATGLDVGIDCPDAESVADEMESMAVTCWVGAVGRSVPLGVAFTSDDVVLSVVPC